MEARDKSTATHLVQPKKTKRETYIGWRRWKPNETRRYWPADFIPSKKVKYFQHLNEIDAGKKNGSWYNGKYLREQAKSDLFDTISFQLELTKAQHSKGLSIFKSENLSEWGIRMEIVAWSLCAYLVHSDENDIRNCHPLCESDSEKRFRQVANSLHISDDQKLSTYCKIQSELNFK